VQYGTVVQLGVGALNRDAGGDLLSVHPDINRANNTIDGQSCVLPRMETRGEIRAEPPRNIEHGIIVLAKAFLHVRGVPDVGALT
jgi:hypothetical protein